MKVLNFQEQIVGDIEDSKNCLVLQSVGLGTIKVINNLIERTSKKIKEEYVVSKQKSSLSGTYFRKKVKDLIIILNHFDHEKRNFETAKTKDIKFWDINSKTFSVKERKEIYDSTFGLSQGKTKVVFITTRILICDLLNSVLDVQRIRGFVILHVEKLKQKNYVSFSLNVFCKKFYNVEGSNDTNKKLLASSKNTLDRDYLKQFTVDEEKIRKANRESMKNKEIFVVAFSEKCNSLSSNSTTLSSLMESLFLNQLILYPRFRDVVKKDLTKQPDVIEIPIELSPKMKSIQQNLKSLISQTIKKVISLNKENRNLFLLKRIVYEKRYFRNLVQGSAKGKKFGTQTIKYLDDLQTLKRLLYWLTFYDCVTFYNYLETLKFEAQERNEIPNWMLTTEADDIIKLATKRVFEIETTDKEPKKKKQKQLTLTQMSRNIQGNNQEKEENEENEEPKTIKKVKWILEENPKWKYLKKVVSEIEEEITSEAIDGLNPNVIILVRNKKVETQIRQYLSIGGNQMLLSLAKRIVDIQIRKKQERIINSTSSYSLFKVKRGYRKPGSNNTNNFRGGRKRKLTTTNTETELKLLGDYFIEQRKLKKEKKKEKVVLLPEEEFELYFNVLFPKMEIPSSNKKKQKKKKKKVEEKKQEITIVIHPLYNLEKIFDLYKPSFFVLYDYNLEVIRRIEMYKASNRLLPVRVYTLNYANSCEFEKHIHKCEQEQNSFIQLIKFKRDTLFPKIYEMIENAFSDNSMKDEDEFVSSRNAGGQKQKKKEKEMTVIVDNREFRADLPICLNEYGFKIIPKHLLVGDYIVTRDLCVERKSIPDLIQSFSSGRLYSQCENMKKHYKNIALLIQFENSKNCSLFTNQELQRHVTINHLASKLIILVVNFPGLLVFWSSDSMNTSNLFNELKKDRKEPREDIVEKIEEKEHVDDETDHACEFLRKLPGVTEKNIGRIKNEVETLADLFSLPFKSLERIFGSKTAARQFYDFVTKGERKNGNEKVKNGSRKSFFTKKKKK